VDSGKMKHEQAELGKLVTEKHEMIKYEVLLGSSTEKMRDC
jgi:hypothetical protein